jgi:hypothetical protein
VEDGRVTVCKKLKDKHNKALVATGLGGQDIDLGGQFN